MATEVTQPDRPRDEVSGADVLVGDMLAWSDLESLTPPLALLEVVAPLLEGRPDRVLLAGPRAALLVDRVPAAGRVDVLVRALPDARTVGDLGGVRDRVRLHCGGLDAFDAGPDFDLVIALGGPERLLGPDSQGLGVAEVVARLAALVREGGTLVVDLANDLGLDDLVSGEPAAVRDSDAGWTVGAHGFDRRHLHAGERAAVLAQAGLVPGATYAALPSLDDQRVLVRDTALAGHACDATLFALGGAALDAATDGRPALRDPRSMLRRVVEAGLLDPLAPAWVLLAHKPVRGIDDTATAVSAPTAHDTLTELPDLVATEGDGRWQTVTVVDHAGRQVQRWADGGVDPERGEGRVVRVIGGGVPASGPLLETLLLDACAARDHGAVRGVVRRYAAWLGEAERRGDVDARFFATPADVVDDAGTLRSVDASWLRTDPVSADVALVRGLRHFARRLLAGASPHPWRVTTTPDELTVTLAAMAGLTVTPSMVAEAARLEAETEATVQGRPDEVELLEEENLAQGRFARGLPARDAAGYRELLAHDRAQARRLREHEEQVAWLEGTLRHRDRYIRTLERLIERYEETLTYRTVQAIRAPRRALTDKAVAAAKQTAGDVLPPETMTRARRLAARMLKP